MKANLILTGERACYNFVMFNRPERQVPERPEKRNISMRKIPMLGAAVIFVALGGIDANAANPNVLPSSQYSILGYDAAPAATAPKPTMEGRAAYTAVDPYRLGNGYVDYKSVGLSSDPEDCNRGCAASNGP
jgi:hypothetical protein